jgi:hypothetical protein
MAHIEQAIFTSAETDRSAGYQVVARSPGVCEADARELAVWGPSHDSLLELSPEAVSFNFHPLPSGAFCVSRTTAAGWEYSSRGGHRIYTQCLIVPPEVLRRFANNPLALMRAAMAGGALEVHDEIPRRLDSLQIVGGAAPIDQTLLARLAVNPGPRAMATLVQAALDSARLAVSGELSAGELIAGLLSCLPPECRTEFSFSTGLKFSSRRPFRIVVLSGDPAEGRWVAHHPNVTVLELAAGRPPESIPIDGWARLIERVLASGRTSFLATQLSKRRFHLTPDDLSALGLQLLEDLDASGFRADHRRQEENAALFENEAPAPSANAAEREPRCVSAPEGSENLTRAHAPHSRFAKSSRAAATAQLQATSPSRTVDPDSPEVLETLERLDDLVYEAIDGQATALEQLERLWPELLAELGDELVAESREQYLRYALSIWEDCTGANGVRNPSRAVRALDVLCVLFEGG